MDDCGVIKSVRELLTSLELDPRITGVWTHVAPDTPYPYITLEWEGTRDLFKHGLVSFNTKIFSDYSGAGPLIRLAGQVTDRLNSGFKLICQRTQRDEAGVGVCTLAYQAFIKNI